METFEYVVASICSPLPVRGYVDCDFPCGKADGNSGIALRRLQP
jgi:hypothetical protein